jgi:hypothetical protein
LGRVRATEARKREEEGPPRYYKWFHCLHGAAGEVSLLYIYIFINTYKYIYLKYMFNI